MIECAIDRDFLTDVDDEDNEYVSRKDGNMEEYEEEML
jgi:hypothetical protein